MGGPAAGSGAAHEGVSGTCWSSSSSQTPIAAHASDASTASSAPTGQLNSRAPQAHAARARAAPGAAAAASAETAPASSSPPGARAPSACGRQSGRAHRQLTLARLAQSCGVVRPPCFTAGCQQSRHPLVLD